MSIGQQIVQQLVGQSLGKHLKMVAKRNCVPIHCGPVDKAAYAQKFHRVAHSTGGQAPIKVQELVGRWSAHRVIAWVIAKLQDEGKRRGPEGRQMSTTTSRLRPSGG